MVSANKIAIIFTCHNRKAKTKRCLDTIKTSIQESEKHFEFRVFICDDGSDDGTTELLEVKGKCLLLFGGPKSSRCDDK